MASNKDDLTDRLLQGTLTEREKEELRRRLRTDGQFRDDLSFDLAFAAAVEQREIEKRAEHYAHKARRARWKRTALIAAVVLLTLAAVVVLLLWKQDGDEPFTDTEAYALLREAINAGEASRELGMSAGASDWQDLLLTAGDGVNGFRDALTLLRSERLRSGDCRFPTNDFYEGLLELYLNRDYAAAEPRLECQLQRPGGRADYVGLRADRRRALLLTKVGLGKLDEAAAILRSEPSLQLSDLPPGSRRQLEAYLNSSPEQ